MTAAQQVLSTVHGEVDAASLPEVNGGENPQLPSDEPPHGWATSRAPPWVAVVPRRQIKCSTIGDGSVIRHQRPRRYRTGESGEPAETRGDCGAQVGSCDPRRLADSARVARFHRPGCTVLLAQQNVVVTRMIGWSSPRNGSSVLLPQDPGRCLRPPRVNWDRPPVVVSPPVGDLRDRCARSVGDLCDKCAREFPPATRRRRGRIRRVPRR